MRARVRISPVAIVLLALCSATVHAQSSGGTEKFVPAAELETIFEQSPAGVLLPRDEYRDLLKRVEEAESGQRDAPATLLVRSAEYTIVPVDNQVTMTIQLEIEQFVREWQTLDIPIGDMLLEKATVGGSPATIGRASSSRLQFFHRSPGPLTLVLELSAPLSRVGGDRLARFSVLPRVAAHLNVECPAGEHVVLNNRRLQRPEPEDRSATYLLPAGQAGKTELRWTTQRDESAGDVLVFAKSDVSVRLSSDTLRWNSETRMSVFGGQISRLNAAVPPSLEVTAVESSGLEFWELSDDPDEPGMTRITLTWRQPFAQDRLVTFRGVAAVENGQAGEIPTLLLRDVTAHTGRIAITHEDQLRLMATVGDGIRQRNAVDSEVEDEPADASTFDYWVQEFGLQVAVRPRDRELFAQLVSQLAISDAAASLSARIVIESLNAPLFETQLTIPDGWQLLAIVDDQGQAVTWRQSPDSGDVRIEPEQPVTAGGVLPLRLTLRRAIDDPDTPQRIALPVVRAAEATLVGGHYTIRSAADLQVSPVDLSGLVAAGEAEQGVSFAVQGTEISGELTIERRPVRLSARSEIRNWMDARARTSIVTTSIDVINGTTRTLQIRLPEDAGDDLHFTVLGIGRVPGYDDSHPLNRLVPSRVGIVETRADEPADGRRLWHLTFDRRFAGSVTLRTRIQQPREGGDLAAPVVEVPGAIHQEGLIVFEAAPDQQFDPAGDDGVTGLQPADPGLATPIDEAAGRRVARVYQFVRPDYSAVMMEARFDTQPVPTAVCRQMRNVSLLSESGSVQRACRIDLHCVGVQTLRFTLPDSENVFLWSTVLNGEAVEVRRDGGHYLVAIPTGDERLDHVLDVLFESSADASSALGSTNQESVVVAIDAGGDEVIPIDVLENLWKVVYPNETLLLDHAGGFHPQSDLDEPGWLQQLARGITLPDTDRLKSRGLVAGGILAAMFIGTVLVLRRRWLMLATAGVGALVLLPYLLLPAVQQSREAARATIARNGERFREMAGGTEIALQTLPSPDYLTDDISDFLQESDEAIAGTAIGQGGGGFGGGGGGMGLGGAGRWDGPRAGRLRGNADENGSLGRVIVPGGPGTPALEAELPADDSGQSDTPTQAPSFGSRQQSLPGQGISQNVPARRGRARLSVRVDMPNPGDYQSTVFRSVGATSSASRLELVIRNTRQLNVLRVLTALVALTLCWWMRRSSRTVKLGAVTLLCLLAIAVVPLIPNPWQAVVDGVVLGAIAAAVLWPVARFVTWVQGAPWFRPSRRVAAALLLLLIVPATGRTQEVRQRVAPSAPAENPEAHALVPNPDRGKGDVVIPYTPGESPLMADKVFVPREEFLRLYDKAYPGELTPEEPPAPAMVVAAFYVGGEQKPLSDFEALQSFSVRYVIRQFTDDVAEVSLPLRNVAVRSAVMDGESAAILPSEESYAVRVAERGVHLLDVTFDVAATVQSGTGSLRLGLGSVPSGTLTFDLPADDLDVLVNGRSTSFRRDGRRVIIPLGTDRSLHIQWQPPATRNSSDTIFHATVNSALEFSDQGLLLTSTVKLNGRQGSLSECRVSLPDVYSVQSVDGADVSGWTVEDEDGRRELKIVFRSPVTANTTVDLTLFSRQVVTSERAVFPVPIAEVAGASRSTGSICVLAGTELDIKTQTLSGVSQINPTDAVIPEHADPNRPRVLAWRYNRHPAEITVRVARVTRRLDVRALHGVRLEPERQRWTSQFQVTIAGAPRRRLDIRIPRSFLAVDVNATQMDDWFVTEPDDDSSPTKTLSIHLHSAQSGSVSIVIQGQNARSADRTVSRIDVPQLLDVDDAETQVSVWLDASSEISGFTADGWSSINPARVTDELRSLQPSAADVSFSSRQSQPAVVTLNLRRAPAAIIGESVTVSNVTGTSIERTLGLSWQISRAATDALSVDLAADVVDTLDFVVPGVRQQEVRPLADGLVRLTFHLQRPVSDRFFVAGVGAIPLPESGEFRGIPVTFNAPEDDQGSQTITSQSHFWVIVNQSGGVLEAVNPADDTEDVSADQIRTKIPEGFLEQSVAIRRITEQQPGSAWRVRFPEWQETTAAVIALAQHVTVLADDASWRSRHRLQVRNESRQFLPVVLPADSRPLYCLVRGRPTRMVTREVDDRIVHLIPIPQTGILAIPFDVEFALAGRFPEGTERVREQWQQRQIEIPVPTFPEDSDNAKLGVTVARNTWSVHVPDSWSTVFEDDPRRSNVVRADSEEMEDAVVMSVIDNSKAILGNVAGTISLSSQQSKDLYSNLQDQRRRLSEGAANTITGEETRQQAIQEIDSYLSKNSAEWSDPLDINIHGDVLPLNGLGLNNDALNEEALIRNRFNTSNYNQLIQSNSASGIANVPSVTNGVADFEFAIPQKPLSGEELPGRVSGRKSESTGKSIQSRSQLMRQQGGQLFDRGRQGMSENALEEVEIIRDPFTDGLAPADQDKMGLDLFFDQAEQQFSAPNKLADEESDEDQQELAEPLVQSAPPARSTGLLSLRFDIPTDGRRFDFVRTGGNAHLTLNVRSSESRRWLFGFLWALGCLVAAVVLLRSFSGHEFLTRLLSVVAVAGLAGWFLFPGNAATLLLVVSVVTGIALSIQAIKQSFRRDKV